MFLADARGLDFLNTVAAPWGSDIEWLGSGQDLLAWLDQAGLLPVDVAKTMRTDAIPEELDTVAAQARALREWFRSFVLAHAGRPIEPNALAELGQLNRLLERDDAYGAIVASETQPQTRAVEDAHEHSLHWRWLRRWRTPDTLLLPIAQAMADLVCDADFTQVRNCEGPTCTMLFLDTTKGHARRWCSMAVCGNRAKQATHRARVKSATER
jgi:predicted RNA-binding Zn ribbon-like protein